MSARHVTPGLSHNLFSLFLAYSLVLSLIAPFIVRRAEAAPDAKAVALSNAARAQKKGGRRDSEVLLRFRSGVSLRQKQDVVSSLEARSARRLRGGSQVYVIHLPAGLVPEAAVAQLLLNPAVQAAEPNYLIMADEVGTKILPPSSTATQTVQAAGGASGAVIAVIDSGVDFNHPDLRSNQWKNQKESDNKRDDDRNGFVDDLYGFDWAGAGVAGSEDSGHGTLVAGIIASQKNTAAASAQQPLALMSLRVLDSNGKGDVASAIEAIDYATTMGASVINCSWGTDENSAFLRQAIERAAVRNILVVASAGNDGRDIEASPYYPASYGLSNLLVVASTDSSSNLASWSNRGAVHAHVAAPGDNITSTGRGGGYETLLGTSASAAIASGIAGLIKIERPSLSAERIREMILGGARAVPALKDKVSSGSVIDVAGAIAKTEALPPNEGRDNRDDNPGNGQGGNNAPGNGRGNGVNGNPVTPPEQINRVKGAPGLNLPNLDVIRNRKPQEPKAVPPIPSTMRAPKDSVSERRDVEQTPTQLLAWSSEVPTVDALLSHARGGVSDSPFSLFGGPGGRQTANNAASSSAFYAPFMSMLAPPTPPGSYNAVADFSPSQNPTGAWSYGYKTLTGSAFTAFSSHGNPYGAGADSWTPGISCPFVTRNNTGATYTYPNAPSVTQPADMLNLHPGLNGERGVVRWTAPAAGTFLIEGRFQGLDSVGQTTTDVAILHNSTTIFAGIINAYGNQATFSVTRTVDAGDTIDFQVGFGSNNSYNYDSTGLAAIITSASRVNFALASNGGTATVSSQYSASFPASAAINGDRYNLYQPDGRYNNWFSAAGATKPDWIEVSLNGSKTIDEIDVVTLQDNHVNPVDPTEATTFTQYGLTAFEVQYWNGSAWQTVPGGSVTGNNKVWRKFTFPAVTTTKVRVLISATADTYSRVVEVEAWGTPASARSNVALASNGATATASSILGSLYTASNAIDGEHKGLNYFNGGVWHSSAQTFPQWIQVDFNGFKTVDEIDVYAVQDNYQSPVEPTGTMTFSLYGLTSYEVQYWNGSSWMTVPGGNVSGNNLVWRKLTFPAITTAKIRVVITGTPDGWTRMPEVEAYGTDALPRNNVALAANGATATASSILGSLYTASNAIDGEHKGLNYFNGGVWHSSAQTFPQWIQVDFNGNKTIDEIDVYSVQDNYQNPTEPTDTMTFSLYGLTSFDVQYWNGSAWMNVPGGSVTGNNLVRRKFTFAPVTTTKIRVVINSSPDGWTRMPEVEAWGTASGGGADPSGNNFSVARTNPSNRTGGEGVDLLSRNANWSLPIVGLKGRAGLDLSLSLSYNSLVWTKSGSSIKFDADHGFPSPGFRLGFPVIQSNYLNAQGVSSYLMITSSGGRVELRQVGTTNVYEAADSSYLQLIESGSGLLVRTKDGTQLWYQPIGGDYQCTQIKDRNGNYIYASYNGYGRMTSITDTVGRVITFNYDNYQNLNSITQSWKRDSASGLVAETHIWATFGWSNLTIQTGFSGLTLSGVQNGQTLPVLTQVGLPDGSRYNFEYTSWGQAATIRNYASDNSELNHVTYNLDTSAGQTDCPRFTEERIYARDWNNNAEAVITYGAFNPASGQAQVTLPDNTVYKELFYTSGWQQGLTYQTENWSGGVRRKWTTTSWTQDDTNLSYQKNPRPAETNIYDEAGNRRRTTVEYGPYAQYGLPYYVTEYKADGTTLDRITYTDYNLDPAYLSRHIIGLVSEVHVADGAWDLKLHYEYDAGGDQLQATPVNATQHDATNYGADFRVGRGNLTSVSRYDVSDITNPSKSLTTTIGYDTNGSVIFTRDPLGHQKSVSYADSFSDGNNYNTFAYPTTVTDPDGYTSTIKYNYTMGVLASTRTPSSGTTQSGPTAITYLEQALAYDSAGRLARATNQNNQAYRRLDYGPNYTQSFGSVNSVADEGYSVEVYDGAGRVRVRGASHPGSSSGYSATDTKYDVMGRVFKQSNPAEVTASWSPTGDDAAGWVYTEQAYDWKGRPTITTNPDTTTSQADYTGCGCAGGEVVTITGESVPIPGTTQTGNRRQKIYKDVLGRVVKTEVLNWDGSVYSTVTNKYNARDQVTRVRQYMSAAPVPEPEAEGSNYQTTTLEYDGYGRLWRQHVPAQDAGKYTTFEYYADDTLKKSTDARGASATFSYNPRHLVSDIAYNAPSGITPTAAVSFAYDAAGHRTSMSDGSGSTTYQYNALSQLESETRTFTGLTGTFTLSYSYNLAGELKSITDPFNSRIDYAYDNSGRLTGVTGTSFGNITLYATGAKYRAWGALKSLDYGDTKTLTVGYNGRLQPNSFEVPGVLKKSYEYYEDGSLKKINDLLEVNSKYDRLYKYDHVGRVKEALSGVEARGGTSANGMDRMYNETFQYDALNHLTVRTTSHWNQNYSSTDSFQNDRRTGGTYDEDGRELLSPELNYTYDAAGNLISFGDLSTSQTGQRMDGDGRVVWSQRQSFNEQTWQWQTEKTAYYVNSSVLGGAPVTEVDANGGKVRTLVYAGGSVLAWQMKGYTGSPDYVLWEHRDASGVSFRTTNSAGQEMWQGAVDEYLTYAEYDPAGADASLIPQLSINEPMEEGNGGSLLGYPGAGVPSFMRTSYTLNGIPVDADFAMQQVSSGAAAQCPYSNCNPRWNPNNNDGRGGFDFWDAYGDGFSGYSPQGARYLGGGVFRYPGEGDRKVGKLAHGQSHETHCMMFARIVDEIAESTKDNSTFVKALVDRFVAPREQAVTGTGKYKEFNNSTGFRPEFTEPPNLPGGSPNQVHHYMGIFEKAFEGATKAATLLTAAAVFIPNINRSELTPYTAARNYALKKANEHEDENPNNPEASKRADKALNKVVVDHAFKLAAKDIDRFQLGNLIRRDVCEQ